MFQIKICGIRYPEDLPQIAAAGADAIGLNFYPHSKRYLAPDDAAAVAAAVPMGVARVGVFVNASTQAMLAAAEQYGLDYLQLHGDEPPEQLVELRALPVIKAFRFGADAWTPIEKYIADCKLHGALPVAVLIDAPGTGGSYGGTGAPANWQAMTGWRSHIDLPLVLAGGLTPDNVAEAISVVRPSAIDTASGVEASNGHKAPERIGSFVTAAKAAQVALHSVGFFGYRLVPNWLAEQEDAKVRYVRILSGPLAGGIGTVLYEQDDKLCVLVEKQHKLTPPVTVDRSITEPYTSRLPWSARALAFASIISFVVWSITKSSLGIVIAALAILSLIAQLAVLSWRIRRMTTCPACGDKLVDINRSECASCHWQRPMPEFC